MKNTHPSILHEDADFVVLNKPSGWLSIPGRDPASPEPVLTLWLTEYLKGVAPLIVHRLDRFTSGVILFAKTAEAHQRANSWFLKREVKKVYHFLASPSPSKPAIQIRTDVDGKPAQTLFEVIQKGETYFYGRATPLTGRFHQIREHAKEAGFPILGDKPYGGICQMTIQSTARVFPHFWLHAFELTLPFGKFQAPLPSEFKTLVEELK